MLVINTIMKPYTYLIKFLPTGRCYYGSRYANVKLKRTAEEDLMLKYPTSCKEIQQLIKEYGLESFSWEVRQKFDTPEEVVAWEKKVLRRCKVLERQDRWMNGNIAGHIIATPSVCKKISEFHKDKPKSEDHKNKISVANKGKVKGPQSAEHRLKNSLANSGVNNPMYGVPCSEERAAKIGAANKGKVAWNKGVPRTEEQKQAQREKMTGRKMLPEQVAKQVASRTGKPRSEEAKNNISKALKGKSKGPMSKEEKLKRSVALKGKAKPEGFGDKVASRMKEEFTENNPNKREDLKKCCPYCNQVFGPSNYTRWHGDNCKLKGEQND